MGNVSAIDGPLVHAQSLRRMNYAQVKGEAGILWPTDHQVQALPAPGPFARVTAGGCAVKNTYEVDSRQVYITEQEGATDLPWPATGSSPASGVDRYVIQRVIDPQYQGVQEPTDPDAFDYAPLEIVDSLAGVTDSYYALWKIHQPANNTVFDPSDPAITVTDLRKVANPLTDDVLRPRPQHAGDPGQTLNSASEPGEYFPNAGWQDIDIPEWATRALIIADWTQIKYAGGKNSVGRYWVEWGPRTGTSTRQYKTEKFGFNGTGTIGEDRGNWRMGDNVYVPKAVRGTTQRFIYKAMYTGADKGVSMDGISGNIMQVRFLQVAD